MPKIATQKATINSWLCYYGDTFGPRDYEHFDLVVLDGINHPPLSHSRPGSPLLLAYLSVGEVDEDNPIWFQAKGQPYLLKKNKFWNSWLVDVRAPAWHREVMAAANRIFNQDKEFDGLFLDTFDSSLSLLTADPIRFAGTRQALRQIILDLRRAHPGKLIAVNRGLPMLADIAKDINFVVMEDLYSMYDSKRQKYIRVDAKSRDTLLQQAEIGRRLNPALTILSLDYAAPNQHRMTEEAFAFSRQHGFIPYVSTYKLDQIFFHPGL